MITSARQSSWLHVWPIEDLHAAGLAQPCLVRFKLFTHDERLVLGDLGALVAAERAGVSAQLSNLLPTGSCGRAEH
jgi:mRNA interferase MazF